MPGTTPLTAYAITDSDDRLLSADEPLAGLQRRFEPIAKEFAKDWRISDSAVKKRVVVLVGAREPSQIAFRDDLARWGQAGARVLVTVDRADAEWHGRVGLVTSLLDDAQFDPARACSLICGPEIMMRFSARALIDLGVDQNRILVSLERNMQCGLGWCGHCQLGPLLLCRDGAVVTYSDVVRDLMMERER